MTDETTEILVTAEQRQAANELCQTVAGDAAEAVALLMLLVKRTPCNECAHFWWGVATVVINDVMAVMAKAHPAAPRAPIRHHTLEEIDVSNERVH